MRWKYDNTYENPQNGDTRTVNKFLLFPRYFNGTGKWLCYAKILEEYSNYEGWEEINFSEL